MWESNIFLQMHNRMQYLYKKMKFDMSYYNENNDFWLVFSSTFCRQYLSKKMKFSTSYWSENKWLVNCSLPIYFSCNVLQEMWLKNWGSHFLFLLHCNKHFFIIINFLKICFQKQGYYIKHIYYHNNGNG